MELKDRFIDEKTKIEYVRVGNYYIPNLTLPKPRRTGNIGKYGRLKLNYMKKHNIPEYTEMLLNNELNSYLLDIEDDKAMNLNENECKMLQQLVSLYLQMSDYEDRKIFFLGARENYFYFKNLGLIKE